MGSRVFWSIIVPAYNESSRLFHLESIAGYLKSLKQSSELIVVNDGSRDDTLTKLEKLSQKLNFKLISYPVNHGKGYAIKQGMLAAKGEYALFLDIDLSTPINQIEKIVPLLTPNRVLIGTRKTKGAVVAVHQPFIRETLGKGFTLLSQIFTQVWVSDFTCGFKCFPIKAAHQIFKASRIYRWGFDSEIIYLAHKYQYQIKEVPVTWTNDTQTKVKFPQDLINSLMELLRIRYYDHVKGWY